MEPLKELFNETYCRKLSAAFKQEMTSLDIKKFQHTMFNGLAEMELNERLRHIASIMAQFLPTDFAKALKITDRLIGKMDRGYTSLIFPQFVAKHGKHHFDLSMIALKNYTSFGSSEFAIREFLKMDFEKTIDVMKSWSLDPNEHVRRLSSEGSRPRLPWSFKLDQVIHNPKTTQVILDNLKCDQSVYVQKSVANHLNDISKDHAEYFVQTVKKWDRTIPQTAWIVKHASRTLIKKGNAEALALFKVKEPKEVNISSFALSKKKIHLGDSIEFHVRITSSAKVKQNIILDYIIHYVKEAGKTSAKVFKWKTFEMQPNETFSFSKKQMIKDFTTRKHKAGQHKIELQMNGKIVAATSFTLIV